MTWMKNENLHLPSKISKAADSSNPSNKSIWSFPKIRLINSR